MDTAATIIGNTTRDPELRYTTGGAAMCSFGVAVNKRKKNQQTGQWEDDGAAFFNVVCWRDLAEHVAASAGKGTRVVVTGRLDQRSWEDREGNKRTSVELIADDVGLSLRWADGTMERTERTTSNRQTVRRLTRRPDPVYGDEEPF